MTVPANNLCALLLTTLMGCCTTTRPTLSEQNYPGTLLPPTQLATEAVWRQRVTATWHPTGQAPQERGFDAALQRQGEALTVIGLSPLGSVGFSIQQTKSGIDVVNNIEDQLIIPPQFILLDVQRAFFPWPCQDWSLQNRDGTRTGHVAGEEVVETWLDGRLQSRTFRRLDDQPAGLITVTYEWQQPSWASPSRAVLNNAWFGYQLTITTSSETLLTPSAQSEVSEAAS